MEWASSSDVDDSYTVVESRKSKSARKKPVVVVSRPKTRSQKCADDLLDSKSTHAPGRVVRKKTKPNRFK
jgi:hypothetical protein